MTPSRTPTAISREQLIHSLYEAAELEHNLMCTYLYAAFSLKDGEAEGLRAAEAAAVARWRRAILDVAIDEMGHLAAIWNITAAIGGTPRFGRTNFPLDPGYLPARIVVKLAPFNSDVLQHFIFLERPDRSLEPEGAGFEPPSQFHRSAPAPRLTPMPLDYETVGEFYQILQSNFTALAQEIGEDRLFCGDRALQLSPYELNLSGAKPVQCLKTALSAFDAIISQGEGASEESPDSHFCTFRTIRTEFETLKSENPAFSPAHPAATNPVLRRPPKPEGRVWIEEESAAQIVDAANTGYQLMLRLLAYAYTIAGPNAEKSLAIDLGVDLMKTMTLLGESAARRPAGASNASCNAGMSFTALRDAAPFPRGPAARRFFIERATQLAAAVSALPSKDSRIERAARLMDALTVRAQQFEGMADVLASITASPETPAPPAAPSQIIGDVERVEGGTLTLDFNAKRCIHSRFCVTEAPNVFLANVVGPWIHPDAMDPDVLMAVARECPSGAIQYKRKDGGLEEQAPPVNLISTREAGPYAFRGDLRIDGAPIGYRATLCRCGASKNKPFCDGSHHDIQFSASGEPPTGAEIEMLKVRNGAMDIAPQTDGPLSVRGNMELISGTGRVVARHQSARLCRCGGSKTKPFCDNTHIEIGFKSN